MSSHPRPRCFPNTGNLLPFDPDTEIPRHASILVTRFPPSPTTFPDLNKDLHGFGTGPTSVAFLLYSLQNDLPEVLEGKSPVDWAKLYLKVARSLMDTLLPDSRQRQLSSRFCGILCERLCWAVTAAAVYEDEAYLEPLLEYTPILQGEEPFDEHAFGRAGYLYLLRLTRSIFPLTAPRIDTIMLQTIDAILQRSPDTLTPWHCDNRLFIGLGHGWIGTIAQILLSDSVLSRAQQLRPWIIRILQQQFPSGNWGMYVKTDKADSQNDETRLMIDEVLEIGHGAPGVVVALLAIRPVYASHNDTELVGLLDDAVAKAQECIWQRGNLSKESCLLHGAAGNSLVLLDHMQRETFMAVSIQEKVEKGKADGSLEASSSPSGLYRGLAGRIWAMTELKKGRVGVFPSFNDV